MALMTLERFKELLNIQDTSYDSNFAIFEPIAESRLNTYVGKTITALTIGYEPYYARLILTFVNEGSTTADTKDVSSKSIGKVSVTFKDNGNGIQSGVALNTDNALLKFRPLKTRIY